MKLIFCLQINTCFLQVESINLSELSQACPMYPEQHVYNIFAISQKKYMKDQVDFLSADKRQRFLQSDTFILGVCGQACAN